MCVSMQNGNSDSKVSYPVATNKFRREDRWGCSCSAPWLTAGVESVGVAVMILLSSLLSLITHPGLGR